MMRRLLLALGFLLLPTCAWAQGGSFQGITLGPMGQPTPGTVKVCTPTSTVTNNICDTTTTIYTDETLTTSTANPFPTDGFGNFIFYTATGTVKYSISGINIVSATYRIVIASGSGGGGSAPGVPDNSFQYRVNATTLGGASNWLYTSATGVKTGTQLANGNDLFTLKRFTDTAPTGNFVRYQNAAAVDLWRVDILGQLQNGILLPTFLSVSTSSQLPNGRTLACGANLACSDGGAGGSFTISTSGTVVDTTSNQTITGIKTHNQDLPLGAGFSLQSTIANDTVTGTTAKRAVKLTSTAKAIIATTTDLTGILGIAVTGAGVSGSVTVADVGQVTWTCDAATTIGHYVQMSTTINGECKDAGATYPTSNQVLGMLMTTLAGTGDNTVWLFPSEIRGSSAGAVTSVFGRTGAVVAVSGDYTAAQVTNAFDVTVSNALTNVAAPATPAAGKTAVWTDTTDKRLHDKTDAGTIGTTVVSDNGAANNFLTAVSVAGVISKAQPTLANIAAGAAPTGTYDFGGSTAIILPKAAGAAPTAQGDVRYDTTQNTEVRGGSGSIFGTVPRVLMTLVCNSTVCACTGTGCTAGTFTNNCVSGGADASCTNAGTTETNAGANFSIPANFFIANKILRVSMGFEATGNTTGVTLTVRLKLGATALMSSNFTLPAAGASPEGNGYTVLIQGTAAPGASVNVEAGLVGSTSRPSSNTIAQPLAVATNGALTLQWSFQLGTATASNFGRLRQMVVTEEN